MTIKERMLSAERLPDSTGWKARHDQAVLTPDTNEDAMIDMLVGWAHYADRYRSRYGFKVGYDGVLGPAWQEIGQGLLQLLNGETGHLDGGTLDHFIRKTLQENGAEVE